MNQKRRNWGGVLIVLSVLWVMFILARSMRSAASSSEESDAILALMHWIFPQITVQFVRKLAHFAEFFVLGGLLSGICALLRRPMLWQPLLAGALVAVADELSQLFYDGRSCEVKDMLLDSLGVLCAVLLIYLISLLRRKQ